MILPFGGPKWKIDDIKIVGVSTDATYISSETPCVHIDTSRKQPLRLSGLNDYFPDRDFPTVLDAFEGIDYICSFLLETTDIQTYHEKQFLRVYFEHLKRFSEQINYYLDLTDEHRRLVREWVFSGLMPFPQAHIYARDPLNSAGASLFAPERMFKVDYAFWTGHRIVAVEIDGGSHIGSAAHVQKDRMLSRAGVQVVHILNEEIDAHGDAVITKLLPPVISQPPTIHTEDLFRKNADGDYVDFDISNKYSPYTNPLGIPF